MLGFWRAFRPRNAEIWRCHAPQRLLRHGNASWKLVRALRVFLSLQTKHGSAGTAGFEARRHGAACAQGSQRGSQEGGSWCWTRSSRCWILPKLSWCCWGRRALISGCGIKRDDRRNQMDIAGGAGGGASKWSFQVLTRMVNDLKGRVLPEICS